MVLSFLSQPDAELNVQVEGAPFYPGGSVSVRISLTPRERFEVRQGRVELTCTETYWIKRTHHNSRGHTTTSMESRQTRLVELSEIFMDARELQHGVPYSEDVILTIPVDAPPTVTGKAAKIVWQLKVALDVPGARDVSAEQELTVLKPHPQQGAETARLSPAAENDYEECALSLTLDSDTCGTGDTLNGRLQVQALRDIEFNEVRVELECSEKAGDKDETSVEGAVSLHQSLSLLARQQREWPFTLQVPPDLKPSVLVGRTSVVWRVKGVFSRRMRTDFSVDREIQVYTRL